MRWRRRSAWLFGIGGVLLAISFGLLFWLALMNAHATPDPSSSDSPLGILFDRMSEDPVDEEGFVEVDWNHWKQVNPDIVAWVNVEGTQIDHPIMRGLRDDPSYYLNHDIYRGYSVYGTPYLDTSAPPDGGEVLNAIIYGHHMDNGSMFSDFASYSDEAYAREHATVYLQTPESKQKLRVAFVSIIDGDATEKLVRFPSEEAFADWYEAQRQEAAVVLESEGTPERVITFCTCSYHRFSNERTLVVCMPEDVAAEHEAPLDA